MDVDIKLTKTGTTIVGVLAKDCVILASDSQATSGNIVSDKEVKKVLKVTDNIAIAGAGLVGDLQALVRFMAGELKYQEISEGKAFSVSAAATFLGNILNAYKYMPFWVQLFLAGYDKAPGIYSLDAAGGIMDCKDFVAEGSGGQIALGVLEADYKKEIVKDEALRLALKAVRASKERDIYTGGKNYNVAVIDKNGFRELSQDDIKKYL